MPDRAGHERIFIALGSNLGDPAERLHAALTALARRGVRILCCSSVYETLPVGGPPAQPNYLNAVAELAPGPPATPPADLLALLLDVEGALGRRRTTPDAPRSIDLDLLLYGHRVISSASLTVPHPRLHERGFVLVPLCEIAPDVVHPVLHRTAQELLHSLGPRTGVIARRPPPNWTAAAPHPAR